MNAGAPRVLGVQAGRALEGDVSLDAEVVIVGSGSGGAVVAQILAEAGVDVVVLEEGPYVPDHVYQAYRPSQTLRHIGREAGTTVVLGLGDTPLITVMAGRAVGGSSILTGGVCFRVPESIHHRWVHERGLTDLRAADLDAAFRSAEQVSHVEEVPVHQRSQAVHRFVSGAAQLGIPVHPMRRNTSGCEGHARCNFGCPVGAKQSVDKTYLPRALAAGARVYADVLVERLTTEGARVSGVEARLLGEPTARGQARRGRLRVRARTVVVAAGSLHSPLLLLRSGLRTRAVGRHLTLHPGFRMVGRFDEVVTGWQGALQSVYIDHFEAQGLTMTALFVPPSVLAAGMPGVGAELAERLRHLPQLGIFGCMVHDDDGGRVRRGLGREPLITYRLSPRNKASLLAGMRTLVDIYLAAGAREVYAPMFGLPALRSSADARRLLHDGVPARRMECVTFHPLGTCRIGRDASEGVVDSYGRAFELEGLVVADGSVFPTSIGVNSQLPIMAMATRIAWRLRDELRG
jgi:choline dehydrogenase-like flavoprotein